MTHGRYDFNGDGIIDSKDLTLMTDKWKKYRRICGEKEHGITF